MAVRGPTQTARDRSNAWEQRLWLARLVRGIVLLVPAGSAFLVGYLARLWFPPQELGINKWLWLLVVLLLSIGTVVGVERGARRLTPLSVLLKMSLIFPDSAPSRFKMAMRSGTTRSLQRRIDEVRRTGDAFDDEVAYAEQMLELVAALSQHDRLTRGHCERVRAYTDMIIAELDMPEEDASKLRWAALLHDVGKLMVPYEILNKEGRPDDHEWELLKAHTWQGQRMVRPLKDFLGLWALAVGQHHERWDGGGYPLGLKGDEIHLGARIVAVADAYDVMTSTRSYKKPLPAHVARAEIANCAGGQFDPEVSRAFLNISLRKTRWSTGLASWLSSFPAIQGSTVATVVSSVSSATGASAAAGALVAGSMIVPDLPVLPPLEPDVEWVQEATAGAAPGDNVEVDDTPEGLPFADESGADEGRVGLGPNIPLNAPTTTSPTTTAPKAPAATTTTPPTTTTIDPEAGADEVAAPPTTLPARRGPVATTTSTPFVAPPTTAAPTVVVPPFSLSGTTLTLAEDDTTGTTKLELTGIDTSATAAVVSPPTLGTVSLDPSAGVAHMRWWDLDWMRSLSGDKRWDIVYRPAPDVSGVDRFTLEMCDPTGCETQEIQVTIEARSDAPVLETTEASTDEDEPITIDLRELISDPDVDDDQVFDHIDWGRVAVKSLPEGFSWEIDELGRVTFHPPPDEHGRYEPLLVVCDKAEGTAAALCSEAVVEIVVEAKPDPPVARNSTVVTDHQTPIGFDLWGLVSDVDGDLDEGSLKLVGGVSSAWSYDAAIRRATFTPSINTPGLFSREFRICDAAGVCDIKTLTVEVQVDNYFPVAVNDVASMDENTSYEANILDNDTDHEGALDAASLRWIEDSPGGEWTLLGGGVMRFVPPADTVGTFAREYRVCDEPGICADATVTITVNSVNDPPVVTALAAQYMAVGQSISIQVDATDDNSATMTYTATGLPAGLSIGSTSGLITGTPTSYVASSSVAVEVSDGPNTTPMTFIIEMSAVEASPDNGVLAITEVLYADWGSEFVEVTNFSAAPVSIDGFRLRDSPDGTFVGLIDRFNYTFPATDEHGNSSDLAPGASAVLWLNSGGVGIENPPGRPADTREYRLDHFDQDLLNASADDLYLYDGSDLLVDYMQWGAVGGTHVADPPGEAYFEHAYRMEYIGAEDGQAIALAVNAGNEDRSGCWMLVPETGAPSNLTDISHRCPEAGVPRDLDPGTRRLSAGWTNMVL